MRRGDPDMQAKASILKAAALAENHTTFHSMCHVPRHWKLQRNVDRIRIYWAMQVIVWAGQAETMGCRQEKWQQE